MLADEKGNGRDPVIAAYRNYVSSLRYFFTRSPLKQIRRIIIEGRIHLNRNNRKLLDWFDSRENTKWFQNFSSRVNALIDLTTNDDYKESLAGIKTEVSEQWKRYNESRGTIGQDFQKGDPNGQWKEFRTKVMRTMENMLFYDNIRGTFVFYFCMTNPDKYWEALDVIEAEIMGS